MFEVMNETTGDRHEPSFSTYIVRMVPSPTRPDEGSIPVTMHPDERMESHEHKINVK